MASWTPDPTLLSATVEMIAKSLSHDSGQQRAAYEAFDAATKNPEFLRYLTFAFVHGTSLPASQRAVAGATAKRMVDRSFPDLPDEVKAYVKAEIIRVLVDPSDNFRRAAANVVSAICRDDDLGNWPALPGIFVSLLSMGDNPAALDGCLTALEQVSDDVPQQFDEAALGHPLMELIPRLIGVMSHPDPNLRYKATKTVGNFLHTGATALALNRQALLAAFAALTSDPTPRIREAVSYALATFLETDASAVWPSIKDIMVFQLRCLLDPHRDVAIAGADFWSNFCEFQAQNHVEEKGEPYWVVEPLMGDLVRALISRMVLTEEDLDGAATEDVDDAAVEDKETDISPSAGKSHVGKILEKGRDTAFAAAASSAADVPATNGDGNRADDEDDYDEDDEDDIDTGRNPNAGASFTVRKSAGGALELLALTYGETMLPFAVDEISKRLAPPSSSAPAGPGTDDSLWREREAALLAIGCLAYGCSELMASHMESLYPFLVNVSRDKRPVVRSSAVWALSKYSGWLTEMHVVSMEEREEALALGDQAKAARLDYMQPLVTVLMERMVDHNKKVQTSALVALTEFLETAEDAVSEHVSQLLMATLHAYPRYQLKARIHAYDVISALAEACPDEFATPEHLSVLGPGLLTRLEALDPAAFEVTILVGCLACVLGAGRSQMISLFPRLFKKACDLLDRELLLEAAAADLPEDLKRSKTPSLSSAGGCDALRASNCLDLIEALVDASGEAITQPLQSSNVVEGLKLLLPHPSPKLRTSAFCLLGTLAASAPAAIQPALRELGPHCAASIRCSHDNIPACNNAIWSLGQLVKRFGRETASLMPRCLPRLVDILNEKDMKRTLYQNVAITLGLIGSAFAETMATGSSSILGKWCLACGRVTNQEEKVDAYSGLCKVIIANPKGAVAHLKPFLRACLEYFGSGAIPPVSSPGDHATRLLMRQAFDTLKPLTTPEQLAALAAALKDDEKQKAAALFF